MEHIYYVIYNQKSLMIHVVISEYVFNRTSTETFLKSLLNDHLVLGRIRCLGRPPEVGGYAYGVEAVKDPIPSSF